MFKKLQWVLYPKTVRTWVRVTYLIKLFLLSDSFSICLWDDLQQFSLLSFLGLDVGLVLSCLHKHKTYFRLYILFISQIAIFFHIYSWSIKTSEMSSLQWTATLQEPLRDHSIFVNIRTEKVFQGTHVVCLSWQKPHHRGFHFLFLYKNEMK